MPVKNNISLRDAGRYSEEGWEECDVLHFDANSASAPSTMLIYLPNSGQSELMFTLPTYYCVVRQRLSIPCR